MRTRFAGKVRRKKAMAQLGQACDEFGTAFDRAGLLAFFFKGPSAQHKVA
ncbi:hypothetical protein [Bordetella bronchiseptica]|nr:hypothetical protein [Bordetella bronchiseptica]